MTDTYLADKASDAASKSKTKRAKNEISPSQINPKNFKTRFGSLPPWGGAMIEGGVSIRFDHDLSRNKDNDQ